MNSLSSILLLSSKKLVLENFHLLCYILSYVETPLSCKLVNYLLQINKYYNTLINKLLTHESFSNIFPVVLVLGPEAANYEQKFTIVSHYKINAASNIINVPVLYGDNNKIKESILLKGVNIIEWDYENYLSDDRCYARYKALFDYIILSSSSTDTTSTTSTNSSNNDTSTSNRMIDKIKLATANHQIMKYILQNIHRTKVKHVCINNYNDSIDNDQMKYGNHMVNNHLQTIKLYLYHPALYIYQFLTSCKFDKLYHLGICDFDQELIFTGTNMPLLTSINITRCKNVTFDQHTKSNLLTLKIDRLYDNYVIFDNMVSLTELDITAAYEIFTSIAKSIHSLTSLISLNITFHLEDIYSGSINIKEFRQGPFSNMKMLKTLKLRDYNNSIDGLFDNLTSLTHLELPNYKYHHDHEEVLPSLPNLTYIKVAHNDRVKVPLFQNINSLKKLDVLSYDGVLRLCMENKMINLTCLNIAYTGFLEYKSIIENIAIYPSLTSLSFHSTFIIINSSLSKQLSCLVNLTELCLQDCELAGIKLADIKNLSKLTIIACRSRYYKYLELKYLIENCMKLKHLFLYDPPLLIDALFTLKQLEIIEFEKIEQRFPN